MSLGYDWVQVIEGDLGDEKESVPTLPGPLKIIFDSFNLREEVGKPGKWQKVQDYWIDTEAQTMAVQLRMAGWETEKRKEFVGVSLWKRRPAWWPWKER